MEKLLTYEKFGKDRISIHGDKEIFGNLLKPFAKWNPRMKGGGGWMTSIENEEQIKKIVDMVKKAENIDELKK